MKTLSKKESLNLGLSYADTLFIPISQKPGPPCWQLHSCPSKECVCHGKSHCNCWEESGFVFRGVKLSFWQDKLKKCLDCPSFLPIGAFKLEGKKLSGVLSFLEEHYRIISVAYLRNMAFDYMRRKLDYYMTHDTFIKDVLNRRGLIEALRAAYESKSGSLCICMTSVDHFSELTSDYQELNKLYGELGNLFLSTSGTKIIARYGMEDFTIVLPDTKLKTAFEFCESLRKEVADHTFCRDKKITISVGIAGIEDAKDPESLIKKACIALNSAKLISNIVISDSFKKNGDSLVDNQKDYLAF
ncbi:MAG: GGDEF domain-containing protein [Nitrospira sp.]|nr:GGDEF domain-containing protein [Nitrospira sp.]